MFAEHIFELPRKYMLTILQAICDSIWRKLTVTRDSMGLICYENVMNAQIKQKANCQMKRVANFQNGRIRFAFFNICGYPMILPNAEYILCLCVSSSIFCVDVVSYVLTTIFWLCCFLRALNQKWKS